MREYKVLRSINLCQGSMSVLEYALQLTQQSNYSPTVVDDSRARMSNIISTMSKMVVKEYHIATLINDMEISRTIVYAH